jgi:hypothetical protein
MSKTPVGLEASATGGTPAAGSRPKLEHAYLIAHEPSKTGALDAPGAELDRIEFQFNPKELTMAKGASWAREQAKNSKTSSPPQYKGPQPSKLALEMFFDASEKQDTSVVKTVDRLFACTVPTAASLQQKKASPPWVIFRWGTLTGFLSYVSSVSAKYTLFTAGGLPIRATCTVTLEELSGDAAKQNPTSGGMVPRRIHELVEGDSLPAIAHTEYGQPGLWRLIAELNRVDDPMRLRPGTRLLLPNLEELGQGPVPRPTGGLVDATR